jgi:hypothetical protein
MYLQTNSIKQERNIIMSRKIFFSCIPLFIFALLAFSFSSAESSKALNNCGIQVELKGTGSTTASVIGMVNCQPYYFEQDDSDPNKYNLSPGYPLYQSMEICVCTLSSTGATTTITTSCGGFYQLTLTSGCSTGCPGC